MRVLNLYSGIGGNRRLWENVEVTAVEYDPKIASIYKDYFPKDNIVVGDAHEYLLKHYKEYDFIWSSPPCPTHSDIRRMGVDVGQYEAVYPDMGLYQEIILLKYFAKKETNWVIENVKPYYEPLISALERDRHLFWSNFYIHETKRSIPKHHVIKEEQEKSTGFNLDKYKNIDKTKILRNCVDSNLGLHIIESAFKNIQLTLEREGE